MKSIHFIIPIILGLCLSIMSAKQVPTDSDSRKDKWIQIETNIKQNKDPKSTLKLCHALLKEVESGDFPDEEVKLKLLIHHLNITLADDTDYINQDLLNKFDIDIESMPSPQNQYMALMGYKLIEDYFQSSSWDIKQRKNINYLDTDITTWTTKDFDNKIALYKSIIYSNTEQLDHINIASIPHLFTQMTNNSSYIQTAHQALLYLDIQFQKRRLYSESISSIDIEDAFTGITSHKKLQSFINDYNTFRNLFSNDIKTQLEIEFWTHLINLQSNPKIDEIYLNNLLALNTYNNPILKAEKNYKIALFYYSKANEINWNNLENIQDIKSLKQKKTEEFIKSISYLDIIIENYTELNNDRHKNIRHLADELKSKISKHKTFNIKGKNRYLFNKDLIFDISSRNLKAIDLEVYEINPIEFHNLSKKLSWNKKNTLINELHNKKLAWSGSYNLVYTTDYVEDKRQIIIPHLNYGLYAVALKGDLTKYFLFQVSDLFIEKDENKITVKSAKDYSVVKNATLCVGSQKHQCYSFNKEGELKYSDNKRDFKTIIHGEDSYYISDQSFQNYKHYDNNYHIIRDEIFTDRAIYRPGQTVHVKVINKQKKHNDLLYSLNKANTIDITLKDSQYETIHKKTVSINEFSSGHTSFVLPKGILNGRFTIKTEHGSTAIQVEEYKRPTFHIEFKKDSTEKRIGDIIQVPVSAKTFSGAALNNATIEYTIQYQNVPVMFWRCGYYNWSQSYILNHQTAQLNNQGEIILEINSNDLPASMKEHNIVQFNIEVKVIDINGDSETETSSFTLSNEGLLIDPINNHSTTEGHKIYPNIKLTNFQGIPIQKDISYTIWKLKEPKHILQSTTSPSEGNWIMPNGYLNTKGLEHESVLNQASYNQWEIQKEISSNLIKANQENEINTLLSKGIYKITFSVKDQKGTPISRSKFMKIYPNKGKLGLNDENIIAISQQWEYQINDTYKKALYLPFPSKYYYVLSDFKGVLQSGIITGERIYHLTQQIKSRSKGGLVLDIKTVYNNKLYQYSANNPVNWEMDLTTKWVNIRNKIQPQSKENWSIKITNSDDKIEDIEVLALMYDVSLDEIEKHNIKHHLDNLPNYRNTKFLKSRLINASFNSYLHSDNQAYYNYEIDNLKGIQLEQTLNYLSLSPRLANFGREIMMASSYETITAIDGKLADSDNMLNARGGRSEKTNYFVDGVKLIGTPNISNNVSNQNETKQILIRKNFQETIFFYPELRSNNEGIIDIPFTMTDGIGQYKLMLFGHSKGLKQFYLEEDIISNKELMVEMHQPRFLYSGDKMVWTAKVTNLSDKPQQALVHLQLKNALNSNLIYQSDKHPESILIQPGESKSIRWESTIPVHLAGEITYELKAETKDYIDVEINQIPILSNQKLIHENFALTIPAHQSQSFRLSELLNSNNFDQFKLECMSNPIWQVIKALPYAKSTDDKIISNLLDEYISIKIGEDILIKNPEISKRLLELSKTNQVSKLRENEDLKSITLEESPWVVTAKNQEEEMLQLAKFFNKNNLNNRIKTIENKIIKHQNSSGGFSWIKNGRDSYHMSLYVAKSLSNLEKIGLGKMNLRETKRKLLQYLDQEVLNDYTRLKRDKTLRKVELSHMLYLELRALFLNNYPIDKDKNIAYEFFLKNSLEHWTKGNFINRIALAKIAFENGKMKIFDDIFRTIDEYRISDTNQHTIYWKELANGISWRNRKLVNHADLIHLYTLKGNKNSEISQLQNWLLQQKRSQHWGSSSETSQIIYSLLFNVDNSKIFNQAPINIKLNGETLSFNQKEGWLSKTWSDQEQFDITNSTLEIVNQLDHPIWISGHQRYFAHISEVEKEKTNICTIEKVFYKRQISQGVESWIKTNLQDLKIGDEIKVNMKLDLPQALDFVYLQDYFGACLDPVSRISGFKYDRKGSYYLNIKDHKMQFFFDHIARGVHEFEFETRVKQLGEFSNGFAEFQSFYAPEFGGHSSAQKIIIK